MIVSSFVPSPNARKILEKKFLEKNSKNFQKKNLEIILTNEKNAKNIKTPKKSRNKKVIKTQKHKIIS